MSNNNSTTDTYFNWSPNNWFTLHKSTEDHTYSYKEVSTDEIREALKEQVVELKNFSLGLPKGTLASTDSKLANEEQKTNYNLTN